MAVFSQLLEDARKLRVPLVVGYSMFLAAWIGVYGKVASPADEQATLAALSAIWDALGDGGRISLVTFAAILVGQLIMNLGFGWILVKMLSLWNGPDWDDFIEEADSAAIDYEEFDLQIPIPGAAPSVSNASELSSRIPSTYKASRLTGEAQDRRRRRDDATFRLTLTFGLLPPLVVAICREGTEPWWVWVGFVVPSLDFALLRGQTLWYMNRKRFTDLERTQGLLQEIVRSKTERLDPEANREDYEAQLQSDIAEAELRLVRVAADLKKLGETVAVKRLLKRRGATARAKSGSRPSTALS